MKKREFTIEEQNYVKENWNKESLPTMEKHLRCNDRTLNRLAKELGLPSKDKRWTTEQLELLENKWGCCKIETLAKNIGKPVSAVCDMANKRKLGPMIDNNPNIYTIPNICYLFSVSETIVKDTWKKRGLPIRNFSISDKTSYYVVNSKKLISFLEKNQDLWDSKKLEYMALGIEPDWLTEKRERDKTITYRTYSFWTDYQKRQAKSYAERGKSVEFIASKVDHTPSQVRAFFERECILLQSHDWTVKDLKFLKENMNTLSKEELANKLGRSVKAVDDKIKILQYDVLEDFEYVFTLEDDNFIKENYKKLTNYQIANHLKISRNMLEERLKVLEIYEPRKCHEWTFEQDRIIIENYEKHSAQEMIQLLGIDISENAYYKRKQKVLKIEKRKELLSILKQLLEEKKEQESILNK